MSTFAESTQRHFWTFTPQQVRDTREATYVAGCAAARRDSVKGAAADEAEPTFAEAAWLQLHFEAKLLQFCDEVETSVAERVVSQSLDHEVIQVKHREHLRRRQRRVAHTALVYFKRVCLRHSLLDPQHNPRLLVLASIYLAAKVEEEHADVTLKQLCERSGVHTNDIVKAELLVLESIDFHVSIFHGFRSLETLLGKLAETLQWSNNLPDIKKYNRVRSAEYQSVLKAHPNVSAFLQRRALELLKRCYFTDAVLIYSPSQLAISCIMASVVRPGAAADVPEPSLISQLKDTELSAFIPGFFPRLLTTSFDQKVVGQCLRRLDTCMKDISKMLISKLPQQPKRAAWLLRRANSS